MAGYMGTEAYDFSLFEPQIIEQPRETEKKTRPQPKKKAATVKTNKYNQTVQRNAQSVAINKTVLKIMSFCLVCGLMFMGLLVMESRCNALDKQITAVQSDIDIAEGETVRLNAELSTKISMDKIEEYAENELGMVKAESYQISYIDLSEGDEIVVSGGKSLDNGSEFSVKVKELFAYIF